MPAGHRIPSATNGPGERIVCKSGYHVDGKEDRVLAEQAQRDVVRLMCDRFAFEEVGDWIRSGRSDEYVAAETRHGVQLRILYGSHLVYYYIVATEDEWSSRTELGFTHVNAYSNGLKRVLGSIYGSVYRRTGSYTSTEVEA